MRLLQPQQTRDIKALETSRDIIRTKELNEASDKARKALADAEADFRTTLARNRVAWAREEEEHETRVKDMKREIDFLQAKRLNEMIPLNILKKGIDDRMQDAQTFLAKLRKREETNEEIAEKLQDKLDEVGQREQDSIKENKRLYLQKEGLLRQIDSFNEQNKEFTLKMQSWSAEKVKSEEDIKRRKTEVILQERTLLAKEQTLKYTDKALNELAIRLADERETLNKAWQELERKKVIPL